MERVVAQLAGHQKNRRKAHPSRMSFERGQVELIELKCSVQLCCGFVNTFLDQRRS